jgi:hypothetical protein
MVFASAHATVLVKAPPGSTFTLLDATKPAVDLDKASVDLVVVEAALRAEAAAAKAIVENVRHLVLAFPTKISNLTTTFFVP